MNWVASYDEIVEKIRSINPVAYARTRNHLSGQVTHLSPYITRGVVTLPQVRDLVLQRYSTHEAKTFIQELAWREYFQNVWDEKGDLIWEDLRFPRSDYRHHELVTGIVMGQTGIRALDESVLTLQQTGYIHNHERMWLSALSSNIARADWRMMSRFMYYYLLDGDIASNTLSWQWVAGTSVNKRYDMNQELINGCGGVVEKDTYLDVERSAVQSINLPSELKASTPFTFTTELPKGDAVASVSNQTIYLYHPWHLSPTWRNETIPDRKILVLEPSHFARYPVDSKVLSFIVDEAHKLHPTIEMWVGEVGDIDGFGSVKEVYSVAHPETRHFNAVLDERERLFPQVTGYHQSFFKFWQECEKFL